LSTVRVLDPRLLRAARPARVLLAGDNARLRRDEVVDLGRCSS
jgi:hypothetical protein